MNSENRISLEDSLQSAIVKMSGGNPGAMVALLHSCKASPVVDPDCMWAEFGPAMACDTKGIYEDRIWMLFKDVCKESATDFLAALRAVQLGLRTSAQLNTAIDNYGKGWDCAAVLADVRKELPGFAA